MKVLVTGATGYVGGRLIPRLLEAGHTVRASATDRSKLQSLWWAPRVECVEMDVTDDSTVAPAVEGMDAVFYLIHGMGGEDFADVDRRSAQNMASACATARVARIVYLSGLVPQVPEEELSEHITSRLEVERILTDSGVCTIALRAAVITGSGSTSFEIVRQISERMPVQTIPEWMDSRVQPIAVTDVVEALAGSLTVDTSSRHYDVGGPDTLAYAELLETYASVAGFSRPQVTVPGLSSDLVGTLAGLITDVPSSTVQALIESLRHDMVCQEQDFVADLLPAGRQLLGLEESFRRALVEVPTDVPPSERDPLGPMPQDPGWAGGQGGGVASAVAGVTAVLSGALDAVRDA